MKLLPFILMIFFFAQDGFAQKNKKSNSFTNINHFQNNMSFKNVDGTRSTVIVNGSSATLANANGTQSSMNICGNSSNIIAADGTSATIIHNALSSSVSLSDGTHLIINHSQSRSSCFTKNGNHRISHNFGTLKEKRYKNKIDVLIHVNWFLQKRALEATKKLERV